MIFYTSLMTQGASEIPIEMPEKSTRQVEDLSWARLKQIFDQKMASSVEKDCEESKGRDILMRTLK